MDIKERLKMLRKSQLHLTQAEFADKISMSRSNLANIESGYVNITDRNIKDICKTFNVSPLWLVDGEGEIFEQLSKDEEIAKFVAKILNEEEESFKRRFIEMLVALSPDEWEILEQAIEIIKKRG